MRPEGLSLAVLIVVLAGCTHASLAPPAPLPAVTRETMTLATTAGPIVVVLYPEVAPATVARMKEYVASGYYLNRSFDRIVPGHVIQVVDATGGATDDNRTLPLEVDARYHFVAGAVGIARGPDPNSGGPEFFIMDFATSHLDGNYTVWGQVVSGLDVVHRIARGPAIDAPSLPSGVPNPLPFDRMALTPVAITATTLGTMTFSGEAAARFPGIVAHDLRVGDYRHSLEAPSDLRVGHEATLAWYIRPSNSQPVPTAQSVTITADGSSHAVMGDPDAAGAYSWTWTPSTAGWNDVTVRVDGVAWATLRLDVQQATPPNSK